MGLAAFSLPKTNGEKNEGIVFSTLEEGVRQAAAQSAGKLLLLADDCSFAPFATMPRVISLLFDGDALPLFAMPDGVSRVLAAGGRETLAAARYFAEVRQIPCTLFPLSADLAGVFEPRGEILLDGERRICPLAEGEALCDLERLRPSLGRAYARILLSRLANFETEALNAFGASLSPIFAELPENDEEIVRFNAAARRGEAKDAYCGEGVALAALLASDPLPEWSAYRLLGALYAAFFEKGKPRRYLLPDYRLRAESAGIPRAPLPPTMEEYVRRAMTLERVRAQLTLGIKRELENRERALQALTRLMGKAPPVRGGDLAKLKELPEHAPNGLSALIRDFGLMEWKNDEEGIATKR